MRTLSFVVVSVLMTSGQVLAESNELYALDDVSKQLLKDAATRAAPSEVVQGAKTAGEAVDTAKKMKETAKAAPDAVKGQVEEAAKESAKQQLKEAVPEEAKEGAKAVESTAKSAKSIKKQVEAAPKSAEEATKAAKAKAKEEATKKALELLP